MPELVSVFAPSSPLKMIVPPRVPELSRASASAPPPNVRVEPARIVPAFVRVLAPSSPLKMIVPPRVPPSLSRVSASAPSPKVRPERMPAFVRRFAPSSPLKTMPPAAHARTDEQRIGVGPAGDGDVGHRADERADLVRVGPAAAADRAVRGGREGVAEGAAGQVGEVSGAEVIHAHQVPEAGRVRAGRDGLGLAGRLRQVERDARVIAEVGQAEVEGVLARAVDDGEDAVGDEQVRVIPALAIGDVVPLVQLDHVVGQAADERVLPLAAVEDHGDVSGSVTSGRPCASVTIAPLPSRTRCPAAIRSLPPRPRTRMAPTPAKVGAGTS